MNNNERNPFLTIEKRTKWIVYERWMNEMKESRMCPSRHLALVGSRSSSY